MSLQRKLRRWFAGTLPVKWDDAHDFLRSSLKKLEGALFDVLEEVENSASLIGRDGGQVLPGGRKTGSLTLTSIDTTPKTTIYFGSAQTSGYDELNDRLGLGTATPAVKLHLYTSATTDVFTSMGPDPAAGPAVNFGYSGASFGRGSAFFNVRPDGSAVAPNPALRFLTVNTVRMILTDVGNIGLNTSVFGTSAAKVVGVGSGTAPTTSPADTVQLWVDDAVAGDANLRARSEGGKVSRLTGLDARLAAQFDKTDVTLANVTGLTLNVKSGESYSFMAVGNYDATAAGGHKYAIAGTCTATSIEYHVRSVADATGAWTASRHTALASATAFAVGPTAGNTVITGTITVNAGGNLTVQFAQQVASGTSSLRRGWTFHMREIS